MGDVLRLIAYSCQACQAVARVVTNNVPTPTPLDIVAARAGCACNVSADLIEVRPYA